MNIICELSDSSLGFPESKNPTAWTVRKAERAILINREGKVALLHVSKDGYHKLPGGGVESFENEEQALAREILEETGCVAQRIQPLGEIREFRSAFGQLQISRCHIMKTETENPTPSFTAEEANNGFSLRWVSPEKAMNILESDTPQNYVGKFIQARDSIFLRGFLDIVSHKDRLREHLHLEKLPEEGGFFRQTYKSAEQVALSRGTRSCGTTIYYLVTPEEFSTLHKVASDEIFHFYAGNSVEMAWISESGKESRFILGSNVLAGEMPQITVPGGTWQGTRLVSDFGWALLGCSVVPGFEYADFSAGNREELLRHFPEAAATILRFTKP